jgi:hypothetical protein
MNRLAIALTASLVAAPLVGAAQTQPPPTPQTTAQTQPAQQKMPDIALTGCLVQGSAPNVFVFQDAKRNVQDTTEKGMKYVVIAGTEDLNLREHLNHAVRITGQADAKAAVTPPAGQTVQEKDLPKLTAKSVTLVSNTCASATW